MRIVFPGMNEGVYEGILEEFRHAMDDDLNTPAAVALMMKTMRQANRHMDTAESERAIAEGKAAAVFTMCKALGIELNVTDTFVPDVETERLVDIRNEARARKDWKAADGLREELEAQGWVVKDRPDGTTALSRAPLPGNRVSNPEPSS